MPDVFDLAQFLSEPSTATTFKMYKAIVFTALVAAANAGIIGAPAIGYAAPAVSYAAPLSVASPALVSQQSNILRTPGNLGQVSTYSKTISTPYSSVSKSDVRVSNDALAYPSVLAHGYAAPAIAAPVARLAAPAYAAPIARLAAPAVATPIGVSYSAAPVVSHISFDGIGAHFAY